MLTNDNVPEFIVANQLAGNVKPVPQAGLAEYLRNKTSDILVDDCHKILLKELHKLVLQAPKSFILWVDLEINPKNNELINGAFLWGKSYCLFNQETFYAQLNMVIDVIKQVGCIGGHNIIDFDIPQLVALTANKIEERKKEIIKKSLINKACDTLMLSSLLIPHQSSHALAKLYRANTSINNPVKDCIESRFIFELCIKAWAILPSTLKIVFSKLLPSLSQIKNSNNKACFDFDSDIIFDLDSLIADLPEGNYEKLLTFINQSVATAKEWSHLGLAVFLNWLRYFQKPQARRPVWINHHKTHKYGFKHAEQAFWQLDDVDEVWINRQCKAFFGFEALREGQMSIVKAVLDNKDIPLGILPTGGGKSLTFQLPALIFSKFKRQLTVIICPLKALIEDQVVNLHSRLPDFESRIAYLTSGQTPERQKEIMTGVWHGDIDILYLSPERLRTYSIRTLLKNRPPAFWVLDETHTLSQWGTDFRPDFLRIADHIIACYGNEYKRAIEQKLKKKSGQQVDLFSIKNSREQTDDNNVDTLTNTFKPPKISLVTATASVRVKDDLESELVDKLMALTADKSLVQYGTDVDKLQIWRDEITAHFEEVPKDSRKSRIYQILQKRKRWYEYTYPNYPDKGVAIVYLRNRKGCDEYAEDFAKQGLVAVAYHSRLDDSQKKTILRKFKDNELQVVVCTNAFGMGIDKEGIHTVVHSGPPANLESYIQEIGRVACKHYEVGEAYMLWSEEDIQGLFAQERKSRIPNTNTLKDCWTAIKPTLKKPLDEQWFPSSALMPILAVEDTEQLNTQIRVALLALERYGLLIEKEQQPAWISIKLLDNFPANELGKLSTLYFQLQQVADGSIQLNNNVEINKSNSHETKKLTQYHLPEIAMVLGYSVKSLLKHLRELVKLGYAQWEVTVNIRLQYSHKTMRAKMNKLIPQLQAMERFIDSHQDKLNEVMLAETVKQSALRMHTHHIDNWFAQHKYSIKFKKNILSMMRALDVLKARQHSKTQVFVSASPTTQQWLQEHELTDTWQNWLMLARGKVQSLTKLFEILLSKLPDKKDAKAQAFDLDTLATMLQTEPTEIIEQLEQLQKLAIIGSSKNQVGKY